MRVASAEFAYESTASGSKQYEGWNMRVLVTGGAGYIGSHAARLLDRAGHEVWIYDNLIYGVLTGQRGWLTPELCVNAWPKKKLHDWLKSKR